MACNYNPRSPSRVGSEIPRIWEIDITINLTSIANILAQNGLNFIQRIEIAGPNLIRSISRIIIPLSSVSRGASWLWDWLLVVAENASAFAFASNCGTKTLRWQCLLHIFTVW